jgi:hypothetical protein
MKTLPLVIALLLAFGLAGQAAPDTTNEDLSFKIGDDWKVASRSETNGLLTVEYSHNGDDINNWKERFTYLRGVQKHAMHSPEDEVKILKAHMEKRCPGASDWSVIAQDGNSILYEWQSRPCGGAPDMHQIARIIQGKYNFFELFYTAKVLGLAPDTRAQWIKTFSDATITTDPSANPSVSQEPMKGQQETHPGPTAADPQASVSPQAPSKPAEDMDSKLSAMNWGENPTANVYLELKETDRKKVRGHTEVTYHFKSSGFPMGKSYTFGTCSRVTKKSRPQWAAFRWTRQGN